MKVVKYVLSLFIYFIVLPYVHGQVRLLKSIDELQVITGPSLVSLRGEGWADKKTTKIGYSLGVGANWELAKKASIASGVIFESKGVKSKFQSIYTDPVTNDEFITQVEYNDNFNYVTIPLILMYSFGQSDYYFFGIGLYGSYLIRQTTTRQDSYTRIVYTSNNTSMWNKYDFGSAISLGFKIPINKKMKFQVQVVNYYGLLNINDAGSLSTYTNSTSLIFGVNFKL